MFGRSTLSAAILSLAVVVCKDAVLVVDAMALCDVEDCWECELRRLDMMFELNVSPTGEVYYSDETHGGGRKLKKKKGGASKGATKYCNNDSGKVTYEECCANRRRLGLVEDYEEHYDRYTTPWATPNESNAELVTPDPGIWKIHHFLDEEMVHKMVAVFDSDDRFDRCVGEPHDHLKCKECFRLSLNNVVDAEERLVLEYIFNKLNNLWPSKEEQRDYLYVQKYHPDCGPTLIHKDVTEYDGSKSATATTVFYLSDGGAGVFFPDANIVIPPESGMALTWLNVHPDGTHNRAASHGIQSTPKDATVRYAISYRVTVSEEELVALKEA